MTGKGRELVRRAQELPWDEVGGLMAEAETAEARRALRNLEYRGFREEEFRKDTELYGG